MSKWSLPQYPTVPMTQPRKIGIDPVVDDRYAHSFPQNQQDTSLQCSPPLPIRYTKGKKQQTLIAATGTATMTPRTLMNKHEGNFPMSITTCTGSYGNDQKTTFSEGESFNAHFIYEMEHVLLNTVTNTQYKVPIASSFKFGFLFNPFQNIHEAMQGYKFSPTQLLDAKPRPKLVAVETAYKFSDNPEALVGINDILFIESIQKIGKKTYIKCTQCFSNLTVMIREDWPITVTTAPACLLLPLDVLLKYLKCPLTVVIDPPPIKKKHNSTHPADIYSNRVVSLLESDKDQFLVCSRFLSDTKDPFLFLLPSFCDIDLMISDCQAAKFQILEVESTDLFREFNITKVSLELAAFAASSSLKNNHSLQLKFYTSIEELKSQKHSRCICPPLLQKFLPLQSVKFSQSSIPNPADVSDVQRLEVVERTVQAAVADLHICKDRIRKVMVQNSEDKDYKRIEELADSAFNIAREQYKEIKILQDTLAQVKVVQNKIQDQLREVYKYMNNGSDYQPPVLLQHNQESPTNAEIDIEKNRHYMECLSAEQITELLRLLQMSEYIPIFEREVISGQILIHLNEHDLAKELQVKSHPHRVRLMQLITGKISASHILKDHSSSQFQY